MLPLPRKFYPILSDFYPKTEREARYLHFTIQRPGDLIYIPHLLAHAVLTLDTGLSTILSRWDAATTSNQRVILQTLD